MKYLLTLLVVTMLFSCKYSKIESVETPDVRIVFLHHSTGNNIWQGEKKMFDFLSKRHNQPAVPWLVSEYNKQEGTKYAIEEIDFPKAEPYGWKNYPFDYYNIWVKNAGDKPFMEEPTLEILTKDFDIIVFKHCFPVSYIYSDDSLSSADSEKKTLSNYKAQYQSLKEKILEFPNTKFLIWTPTALVQAKTTEEQARRADKFSSWIIDEWDDENDNIYLWDFRELETEGGLYLKNKYARSKTNSHPSEKFNEYASEYFVNRLISVIEHDGTDTDLVGNKINY
jgi:hypothetical protein